MSLLALKLTSLQRCVARARDIRRLAGAQFRIEQNLQDAAVLNVIRACETAIDLASMIVRARALGIPTESREAFAILEREALITTPLSLSLRAMVGFRNLVVRQYRDVNIDVVESVIDRDLDDLLVFGELCGKLLHSI